MFNTRSCDNYFCIKFLLNINLRFMKEKNGTFMCMCYALLSVYAVGNPKKKSRAVDFKTKHICTCYVCVHSLIL